MTRLAWATDLHLPAVESADVDRFCADIRAAAVDGVLLGGDLAESTDLVGWLERLDAALGLPVHFVLGNHDYYGGDVRGVRATVRALGGDRLRWLPAAGRVPLGDGVSLVGHDGWGDCRLGDVDEFVTLTDYLAIRDLAATIDPRDLLLRGFRERDRLREKLRALGDDAAATLRGPLEEAVAQDRVILVLTHVPPFREAAWHRGRTGEGPWLPGFTCKALGDLLLSVARRCPDRKFVVLCGHTHGAGHARLGENLEVHTGFGDYGILRFEVLAVDGAGARLEPREGGK